MRINGNSNIQSILKRYDQNVKKTDDVQKTSVINDKVEISNEAREFQVAMQAASANTADRTQKVDTIKAQIASGNYKIDADALAEKILKG